MQIQGEPYSQDDFRTEASQMWQQDSERSNP